MQRVYDVFGPLHDPALEWVLPVVDGAREPEVRAGIVARFEPLDASGWLLDVSSGTGRELAGIARRFPAAHLVGVDISPGMMRLGRRNLQRAGVDAWLALADAHTLPFPDATFHGVMHVGGLNGFTDKRLALAEMFRVARPGAPVVVVDEQLASGRQGLRHRLAFRALTWYDAAPVAPVDLLPAEACDPVVHQVSRFYYTLVCRKAG